MCLSLCGTMLAQPLAFAGAYDGAEDSVSTKASAGAVANSENSATEIAVVNNNLLFSRAHIINRNPHMGQRLMTKLKLVSWIEIPIEQTYKEETVRSYIGLTESNRLYHVMQIGQKNNFARRLSGDRCIQSFSLQKDTHQLQAVDCKGNLLNYYNGQWAHSPSGEIFKKRSLQTIIITTLLSIYIYWQSHQGGTPPDLANALTVFLTFFTFMASSQAQLAMGFVEYGHRNQAPDGFVEVAKIAPAADGSAPVITDWASDCHALISNRVPDELAREYDERALP